MLPCALITGLKEDGARLFSVVSSSRTRGNRHPLKYMKIYLSIRNIFFTPRGQTLKQLDGGGCGVFILGDSQNPPGQDPEQSVLVDTALSRRAGPGNIYRFLPTSTFLWSCDIATWKWRVILLSILNNDMLVVMQWWLAKEQGRIAQGEYLGDWETS